MGIVEVGGVELGAISLGSRVVEGHASDLRASTPRAGELLADKYRIEGVLGEGGMGIVLAARNEATGKRVALKWVHAEHATNPEVLSRFEREARAAGRIEHPNVVTIYDVGRHGDASFLVMELLDGQPLSDIVERTTLSAEEAIGILIPAMRGIDAAHAEGVIHRDLKPENIFLCRAADGSLGTVKVLDFGVSKLMDDEGQNLRMTKTGTVVGTPYYMSPEQVRGVRDIDARIDVYALGVILYEMLAHRPPFVASSYSALMVEIATGTPARLSDARPDIDAALVTVVERAMARERSERYQDVASFARALEPFAAGGMKFSPDRPDWTSRLSLKGTPMPVGGPEGAELRRSATRRSSLGVSQQATMAAPSEPSGELVEIPGDAGARDLGTSQASAGGESAARPSGDEEPASVRSAPTEAATALGSTTLTATSDRPPGLSKRPPLLLIGVAAAVLGIVALALALIRGGTPDAEPEPVVRDAPATTDTPQAAGGEVASGEARGTGDTPEASAEVVPGEAETGEPGTASEETLTEETLTEETATAEPEAQADEGASGGEDTGAWARRRALLEARRRAAAERAAERAAAEPESSAEALELRGPSPTKTSMRTPRAGTLSIEDF